MTRSILDELGKRMAALAALQPMEEGRLAKLQKKMRLEWNYNSNHIEGNTLTYGETELLLIFDQTKGDHEFREYEEMKGHDVALKMVEDLAKDKERELTESFICNLNKLILKEPFYKEAVTPDWQPTRRLIKIGEYKGQPNSVRLQNGEMFHYTSPAETPAAMYDLLQWYRQAETEGSHHPVTLAAELHYRFVLIHPFDDGNGRISRLLMNYHLLRHGYPPVIIKSADKKNYLRALHEADTGNVAAFVDYVAEQLLWSYEIAIKAAKGESIDEVGDWEKEIELLKRSTPIESIITKQKSYLALHELWHESLKAFLSELANRLEKIDPLFSEKSYTVYKNDIPYDISYTNKKMIPTVDNLINIVDRYFTQNNISPDVKLPDSVKVGISWANYLYNGTSPFDIDIRMIIHFSQVKYRIGFDFDSIQRPDLLYTKYITESERNVFIDDAGKYILDLINMKTGKL